MKMRTNQAQEYATFLGKCSIVLANLAGVTSRPSLESFTPAHKLYKDLLFVTGKLKLTQDDFGRDYAKCERAYRELETALEQAMMQGTPPEAIEIADPSPSKPSAEAVKAAVERTPLYSQFMQYVITELPGPQLQSRYTTGALTKEGKECLFEVWVCIEDNGSIVAKQCGERTSTKDEINVTDKGVGDTLVKLSKKKLDSFGVFQPGSRKRDAHAEEIWLVQYHEQYARMINKHAGKIARIEMLDSYAPCTEGDKNCRARTCRAVFLAAQKKGPHGSDPEVMLFTFNEDEVKGVQRFARRFDPKGELQRAGAWRDGSDTEARPDLSERLVNLLSWRREQT